MGSRTDGKTERRPAVGRFEVRGARFYLPAALVLDWHLTTQVLSVRLPSSRLTVLPSRFVAC
jgi:hypothetical protein